MEVIGISGQVGAGKSTLAELMSANGFGKNLEVDALGHELLKDESVIAGLIKAFGEDILSGSQVDRRKLGAKAFEKPESTEALDSIMHPAMVGMVEKIIEEERGRGAKSIIINAALLYKMNLDRLCTKIIYVKAKPENRIKRLVESRGWTEERARQRLFSQDPEPTDPRVIVLNNDESLEKLYANILLL